MAIAGHASRAVRTIIGVVVSWAVLVAMSGRAQSTIPDHLADREFWQLFTTLSEPDGKFDDENYLSNESGYQHTMAQLQASVSAGGVFVGVGPEQNFHYAAALRPALMFVIDIRRQNAVEHLLYKALFELADDRADFLSRLFSRSRSSTLTAESDADTLFAAFAKAVTDRRLTDTTLASVENTLINTHHFPLDSADRASLRKVLDAFCEEGPSIMYVFKNTIQTHPTYAQLMTARDEAGRNWSYLGSRDAFERVRAMERKNLVVPVVGDFSGPKALRAIGAYVRNHGAQISAFYASNVETYLFTAGTATAFYENLQTMPFTTSAPVIRSFFGAVRDCQVRPTIRTPVVRSMRELLEAHATGALRSSCDLVGMSK